MQTGTAAIKEFINHLSSIGISEGVTTDLTVTAEVNRTIIINQEKIRCNFTNDGHTGVVNTFWDESGYKNYSSLGLFGYYKTGYEYPIFVFNKNNSLEVSGKNYKITIT